MLGVDGAGLVTAVWERATTRGVVIQARQGQAGAGMGPIITLSGRGVHASASDLGVGPDGTVTVLWDFDTTGQTFLRGHQLTDENGYVEFDTIVPGWEVVAAPPPLFAAQRATHIHIKAFHEREVLTTQLFMPDPLLDQLYADAEPYKSHRLLNAPGLKRPYERIRNSQDYFFNAAKAKPVAVEPINGVLTAKVTLGVISNGNRGFRPLWR